MNKERTTLRREGYLHQTVRPGYLPALQGRSKGAALTLRFYLCPLIVAQFCRLVYKAWFYTFSMRQERGVPKQSSRGLFSYKSPAQTREIELCSISCRATQKENAAESLSATWRLNDKEFRTLRRATKGFAFGNHSLLKKAGENFISQDSLFLKSSYPNSFTSHPCPCSSRHRIAGSGMPLKVLVLTIVYSAISSKTSRSPSCRGWSKE